MTPLLSNSAYTPQPVNIAYSRAAFLDLIEIRYSSRLFRMPTFNEVQQNLTFLNTGPAQIPGLIVMKLDANGRDYGPYSHVVVIFNATRESLTFADGSLQDLRLQLHPVQRRSDDVLTRQSSFDSKQGAATVEALTTAVFVSETE
jgi:pullulanase